MSIYKLLESKQRRTKIRDSYEYTYVMKQRAMLEAIPMYRYLIGVEDDISLIRSYATLKSLENKEIIESLTKKYQKVSLEKYGKIDNEFINSSVHKDAVEASLPYLTSEDVEYFVPIFPRALNRIYSLEPAKLLSEPYDAVIKDFDTTAIDLFEFYNFLLFDSTFTRLMLVKRCEHLLAMYHPDFRTLYFINDQGRIDNKICLFDKYIKKVNTNHIIERLIPAVDAYVNIDKNAMIKALVDNDLISVKIAYINRKKERRQKLFKKII